MYFPSTQQLHQTHQHTLPNSAGNTTTTCATTDILNARYFCNLLLQQCSNNSIYISYYIFHLFATHIPCRLTEAFVYLAVAFYRPQTYIYLLWSLDGPTEFLNCPTTTFVVPLKVTHTVHKIQFHQTPKANVLLAVLLFLLLLLLLLLLPSNQSKSTARHCYDFNSFIGCNNSTFILAMLANVSNQPQQQQQQQQMEAGIQHVMLPLHRNTCCPAPSSLLFARQ